MQNVAMSIDRIYAKNKRSHRYGFEGDLPR